MTRKILLLVFIMVANSCFAADEIIFNGNITLNGKKVNGSVKASMPKPAGFWNQDNSPMVMAGIFKENGYDKAQ